MAKKALVTGGGGYIGNKLCLALLQRGYQVTSLDLHYQEEGEEREGLRKIHGDIRDKTCLQAVFQESQADVVFHVASYGMSGRDMLKRRMIEDVNIQGTKNVIEACLSSSTPRLVYTSTYNVVFGGQEIKNGDFSLPYLLPHQHVDHYSRTKCIAEQEVRSANGRRTKGGVALRTCALRCAGIYGEGEQRHLPRIVSYIEGGMFRFTYGSADNLVEFLHADNFCQAHIKAAEAMEDPQSPVIGNGYFISDGRPINNFQFFRPLVEGLGYPFPSIKVPLFLVYYTAFLIEMIHHLVGRTIYNFQPLLTRAEVYKTGVTHYFDMTAARTDFDYRPEPRDLTEVVRWFRRRGHGRHTEKEARTSGGCGSIVWGVAVKYVMAIVVFALVMYFIPVVH